MSTYTFYNHAISGDIATLDDWRSDYESMDVESWHGKPSAECNREDWIKDGKLEAIELNSDDDCFLTNRLFPGWYGDASEGEEYQSEWACYAEDEDGERYKIVWMFPAVKGEEPEDDGWPWDDESFIHHIETQETLNRQHIIALPNSTRSASGYRVRDVTEMRKGKRRITTCKLYARTGTSVDSAYAHIWTGSVSGWSLTAAQILEKAVNEYLEEY